MDRVKSEDVVGAKGRSFTGVEYRESLRDVVYHGRLYKKV